VDTVSDSPAADTEYKAGIRCARGDSPETVKKIQAQYMPGVERVSAETADEKFSEAEESLLFVKLGKSNPEVDISKFSR